MVQDMAIGARRRQQLASQVLPVDEWDQYMNKSSDVAGFLQLIFHVGCAVAAGFVVHYSLKDDSRFGLVVGELLLGFVSSFYFMCFHELIHNTAFKTKWINTALAKVLGVFIFRGADWFWAFHWLHHRYTQDPERDPELSGGSSDLADPSRSVLMYARFLTGWPFGFERVIGMVKMALGLRVDPWVIEAGMERVVRVEAIAYAFVYLGLFCGSLLNERVQTFVLWYWLLPHCLGAGHLRYYQFAEHRACESGDYTQLDAWGAARSTNTWWFYRRLAWNMPFHVEHHAWPAIPFHLLPAVHNRIKRSQPASRCLISGQNGYLGVHYEFLRRIIRGEPTGMLPLAPSAEPEASGLLKDVQKNRLSDSKAMAALPRLTTTELEKHNAKADCWVSVMGIVVDATPFLPYHPGGEMIITSKAGTDVTKLFKMIHPEGTLERHLPDACIVGVLTDAACSGLSEPLLSNS
eukprot:TRINITY_DN21726_c0_g1_i1.p1 TRINITY_DN21726_c0_g1~~TRINITY_DN21726_c0_g1_i1.p1  ORF type:complete len:480 (+),score=73.83 TRINITY_DN21726_c0_g1_i1:53-1441(+)